MKKMFYSMAEAIRLTGEEASTLYFWEKKGLINPSKTDKGTRQFTEDDLNAIRNIRNLRDKGNTIKGIKSKPARKIDENQNRIEAINRLKTLRQKLNDLKKEFELNVNS
jgi:DNA-binding transcriptional MerR regulator